MLLLPGIAAHGGRVSATNAELSIQKAVGMTSFCQVMIDKLRVCDSTATMMIVLCASHPIYNSQPTAGHSSNQGLDEAVYQFSPVSTLSTHCVPKISGNIGGDSKPAAAVSRADLTNPIICTGYTRAPKQLIYIPILAPN